jgi:hypothetical protein
VVVLAQLIYPLVNTDKIINNQLNHIPKKKHGISSSLALKWPLLLVTAGEFNRMMPYDPKEKQDTSLNLIPK